MTRRRNRVACDFQALGAGFNPALRAGIALWLLVQRPLPAKNPAANCLGIGAGSFHRPYRFQGAILGAWGISAFEFPQAFSGCIPWHPGLRRKAGIEFNPLEIHPLKFWFRLKFWFCQKFHSQNFKRWLPAFYQVPVLLSTLAVSAGHYICDGNFRCNFRPGIVARYCWSLPRRRLSWLAYTAWIRLAFILLLI